MSNQFGLRNLLVATAVSAGLMLLAVYTLRNPDSYLAIAVCVCLAMIASTFILFGIAFTLLLPIGVLDSMAREASEKSASPFATDRLPEQQIVPRDIEPSR